MLYMDADEYWLDKTGEDTRPFMMSMSSIVSSVASALSGILFGVALTMCNYNESIFILEGKDASTMTAWLGLSMTVGYLLYVVVLAVMHNVKDGEMEAIVQ